MFLFKEKIIHVFLRHTCSPLTFHRYFNIGIQNKEFKIHSVHYTRSVCTIFIITPYIDESERCFSLRLYKRKLKLGISISVEKFKYQAYILELLERRHICHLTCEIHVK